MKIIAFLLLVLVNPILAESSKNNCISNVCFPAQMPENNLQLLKVAKYRYFGFSVYAAALYSTASQKDIKNWIDTGNNPVPVALTLHYFMEFTPEDFQKSGTQLIRENKNISFDSVRNGIEKINMIYAPVDENDQYTILFIPGVGTKLLLNGESRGIIEGDEFARAYLGIWLSQTSVGESFTDALLGVD